MTSVRPTLFLVAAALLLGPVASAGAAAPGDTLLASGMPGLAPPTEAQFAWGESGFTSMSDNDPAGGPSSDGALVVFSSDADGLAQTPEDRRYTQVLVKNRATGALTDVTSGANGSSDYASMSKDGTRVAFVSTATNLAVADPTPDPDVYVKDLTTGVVTLISSATLSDCDLHSCSPQLSGNGQVVAYVSDKPLDAVNDTNANADVYRRAVSGGAPVLISAVNGTTAGGPTGYSEEPSINDTGNTIGFVSTSPNLTTGDANTVQNVFIRRWGTNTTILADAITGSTAVSNGQGSGPKVSGDGSFVAFASMSTDLGDGDTDAIRDVHRRDINIGVGATGATVLISRATGVGGAKGDGNSGPTGISTTGARVAFTSSAASLGALGGFNYAAFVRDHAIGATTMLAAAGNVNIGMGISGDGKVAAFTANAAATPGAPPASVYVRDLAAPDPELVSQPASGPLTAVLSDADYSYYEGNPQALSADGRYVVFATRSPGLIGDANIDAAIFRRDLRTGDVVLVSRKTGATGQQAGYAAQPTISADGSKVSFVADDALDPADNNGVMDVYVRDLAASTTTLASRADTPTGAVGSGNVARQQLSADGRHVLFLENATNLGGPGEIRAYVRDLVAATTTIADRADDDTLKSDPVDSASVSGDGRLVAFASTSSDLGDGDTDNKSDIHLRDLAAQTTTLVSRADGPAGVKGDLLSVAPVISTDGTVVAFRSYAKNLDATAGPWPVGTGVMAFTRDLATGVTRLVSRAGLAGPAPVAGRVSPLALSRDGAVVSYAADGEMAHALDPAAPVDADAVVVRTRSTGAQTVVHVTARRDPTELSDPAGVTTPALSADGSCLAFSAQGLGMQPFVAADTRQWYVRVLSGSCGTVAPPAGPPVIPSPVPITPPATTAVPKVTKLSLSVRRFKVGTKRTAAIAVVKKKTTPASTTIRFTLSAAATATLAFEQRTTGRRSGTRCVQATRKLASHAKCTRYVRRLSITRKRSKAGAASVVFTGRVGTKKLAVGSYRVVVTAKNASGTSKSVTAAFTVVRR